MGGGASEYSPLAFRDNNRLALFGKKFKFLRKYFECNRKHKLRILSCHCGAAAEVSYDNRINSNLLQHVKNLFTNSPIHLLRFKCPAFTLAEVLITLGIIGIVAAMTLPALIKKQQKRTAALELKVAYTKLYNAIKMAETEHGEAKYWQYFDENLSVAENSWKFANTYIAPYFKTLNIYRAQTLHECKNITYKSIDGSVQQCNSVIGFCSICGSSNAKNMTQIHLPDGTIIILLLRKGSSVGIEIDIDTNGYKGPNQWGKDVFRLYLGDITNYQLSGMGHIGFSRNFALNSCASEKGISNCAGIIIMDGWKIKDDYPWK